MRSSNGFSLIELLIVVTIILIIAAIAIPKMEAMRQQSNSAAAVGNLRTLNNALASYQATYPQQGYPKRLRWLGPTNGIPSSTTANLVDESLAFARITPKQGYFFNYSAQSTTPVTGYVLHVNPATSFSGTRYFFTDESTVIRYNDFTPASYTDPPINQ